MLPARRIQLQKFLDDAYLALHQVNLGQTVRVFVDQTGERVEYGPTNAAQLQKYVASLEIQLGLAGNTGPFEPWMV